MLDIHASPCTMVISVLDLGHVAAKCMQSQAGPYLDSAGRLQACLNKLGYTKPSFNWKLTVFQAGHALAAASEGVGVQHLGAFTLLLLPGAYVALDAGALAALRPWRTLRVSRTLQSVLLCTLDRFDIDLYH